MASYTQLEPNSLKAISNMDISYNGTDVSFLATSSFLFVLLFSVIIAAAFYEYVLAGIHRMRASEPGVRESNAIFKRTTLGLLGVFGLFVILASINSSMLSGDISLSDLQLRPVQTPTTQTTSQTTSQTTNTTTQTPSSGSASYAARKKSHEDTVARFAPSNIHTNKNDVPCTEAQFNEAKPSCTSLAFMPEETIQMILKINSLCNCTVVITGGTEPGHQTHGENKRPFDLRLLNTRGDPNNPDPLYVFIKGVATNKYGPNNNCYERYIWNTFTFCDEKPPNAQHLHVY